MSAPSNFVCPEPIRRDYEMPGGTLSGVHFGRIQNPLKLIFLHANGFNAYAYKEIFEALGVHVLALDMRGHGFTKLPTDTDTLDSFHIFRDDIVTFFDRYVQAPVVLAGHSLGAVCGILAAPHLKTKLRGYVGFDPVSLPWYGRMSMSSKLGRKYAKKHFNLARNAGRRKSVFNTHQEAFDRYNDRSAFRGAPKQILKDYLTGGLALKTDGTYHLCCAPLWEQAVYVAQGHNLYKAARALPDKSHLMYAGQFSGVSTPSTRRAVQKAQPNINVSFHTELTHLFPLQTPEVAIDALRQMLAQVSLS